jgi:hypothetical protein
MQVVALVARKQRAELALLLVLEVLAVVATEQLEILVLVAVLQHHLLATPDYPILVVVVPGHGNMRAVVQVDQEL